MTRTRPFLLWASLALNAFLAALVGAHLLHAEPAGHRPPGLDQAIAHMAQSLPSDDAQRFRAALAGQRTAFAPAHARVDEARQALSDAIARTPYDEAAVRQAMADWRTSWQEFAQDFGDSIVVALRDLSPEGRARLAAFGAPAHREAAR
jgi:uncharacterized membrane protein